MKRAPKKKRPHRHLFKLAALAGGTGYVAKCECGVLLSHTVRKEKE